MKLVITILLSCSFILSTAQISLDPSIDSVGKSIASFVPFGWEIIDTAFGDLNNDKLDDVAMVLESKDTIKEYLYNSETKKYDDLREDRPRILLILFKNSSDGTFQLMLRDNQLMLRSDEGGMSGDPFVEPMTIEKNVLTISFMGGTSQKWMLSYKFRYQKNDFYLIGASSGSVHTSIGTFENHSYNFMTNKVKIETCENVFDDNSKMHTKWKVLPKADLKKMKSLIRPYLWEIEPGIRL